MNLRIFLLALVLGAHFPPAAAAYEVHLRGGVTRVRLPGIPVALETDDGAVYVLLSSGRDRVVAWRGGNLATVRGTEDALHLFRYGGRLYFGTDDGGGEIKGIRVVARHPVPESYRAEGTPILVYPVPPHGHLIVAATPGYEDGRLLARVLHVPPGLAARHPREVTSVHDPADRIVFPPGEQVALFRSIDGGRPALVYYDLQKKGSFRRFDAGVDPRDPCPTADGAVTLFRDARAADALVAHYRRPNELVRLGGEAGRLPSPAPWNRVFAFLVAAGRAADLWIGDFRGRAVPLAGARPLLAPRSRPQASPVGVGAPGVYADLRGVLPVRPVFPAPDVVAILRRDGADEHLVLARFAEIYLEDPEAPIEDGYEAPPPVAPPPPSHPARGRRTRGLPPDLRRLVEGEEK